MKLRLITIHTWITNSQKILRNHHCYYHLPGILYASSQMVATVPSRLVELFPIDRWGKLGSERYSNWLKDTQTLSGKSQNFNSGLFDFSAYPLSNMLSDPRQNRFQGKLFFCNQSLQFSRFFWILHSSEIKTILAWKWTQLDWKLGLAS